METLKAVIGGALAAEAGRRADAVVTHIKGARKAAPIQRGDIKGLKDLILSGGGIGPSSASDKAKEALETFSIADDGSLVDQNCKKNLVWHRLRGHIIYTWRILGAYYSRPLVGGRCFKESL
jgi:hypothetical protein